MHFLTVDVKGKCHTWISGPSLGEGNDKHYTSASFSEISQNQMHARDLGF